MLRHSSAKGYKSIFSVLISILILLPIGGWLRYDWLTLCQPGFDWLKAPFKQQLF